MLICLYHHLFRSRAHLLYHREDRRHPAARHDPEGQGHLVGRRGLECQDYPVDQCDPEGQGRPVDRRDPQARCRLTGPCDLVAPCGLEGQDYLAICGPEGYHHLEGPHGLEDRHFPDRGYRQLLPQLVLSCPPAWYRPVRAEQPVAQGWLDLGG